MNAFVKNTLGIDISNADIAAMLFFFCSWFLYSVLSEKWAMRERRGVLARMHQHRHNWMMAMVRRENRLSDVNAVGNLMRSIAFFASTSVLIIIGSVSVLNNHDTINNVVETIPFARMSSPFLWEIKLAVMVILFMFAFFKFTWSLRQYNYLNVIIVAAPSPDTETGELNNYALKASELATNAARHFGYGLRAYYFAMAVLAWFINPQIFAIATAWVVLVLYRREFRSRTLIHITGT